ncbi:MAG: PEP-CTERM sorting domain-containing protein [Mariniblastus sp.]
MALPFRISAFLLVTFCAVPVFAQSGQGGISSSNTGSTNTTGININDFVGADRFYSEGFTGTRAVVAVVEGGHADLNHETSANVTTQVLGTGVSGTNHDHATAVTHATAGSVGGSISGTNYSRYGISYDSEVWTGDIATGFNANGSYQLTWASIASTYSDILDTGVGGRTADVFNSSWWFGDPSGVRRDTMGVDGLLNHTGKVGVIIAGNGGSGDNTVLGMGSGYNSITVGATGPDEGATPYGQLTSFSGVSPNEFSMATGTNSWNTISAAVAQRAAVDIVAPGQSLTLAFASQGNTSYGSNWSGTSFAAPIVAGGTGLMVDAGKAIYTNPSAIDGRVIKAALMNSAQQLSGWDNAQTNIGGVITTTQALDFGQGTGQMDLNAAFDQYVDAANGGLATTTDVAGTDQGDLGNVGVVGWDFGQVDEFDSNFYFFDQQLEADSDLRVTLTWFADRDFGSNADFAGFGEEHLANLDLAIFQFDNLTDRNILGTVAESISLFNVVEHLDFEVEAVGYYGVRVDYTSAHWNFTGETNETYGIAWRGVGVPEPTTLTFLVGFALATIARRRRVG